MISTKKTISAPADRAMGVVRWLRLFCRGYPRETILPTSFPWHTAYHVFRWRDTITDMTEKKAVILETWKEGEDTMVRYESGMIRNQTKNKIVKPVDAPYITKENSRELRQRRVEIAAEKLREAISMRTFGKDVLGSSAEAVGMAGGMLWEEIVLNKLAPTRERLQAYSILSKHANLLSDMRMEGSTEGLNLQLGPDLARELIERLMNDRDED